MLIVEITRGLSIIILTTSSVSHYGRTGVVSTVCCLYTGYDQLWTSIIFIIDSVFSTSRSGPVGQDSDRGIHRERLD